MKLHTPFRNSVGAMEKQLEKDLRSAGYVVMNEVKWKHSVNDAEWIPIRLAFATDFPKLKDLK